MCFLFGLRLVRRGPARGAKPAKKLATESDGWDSDYCNSDLDDDDCDLAEFLHASASSFIGSVLSTKGSLSELFN